MLTGVSCTTKLVNGRGPIFMLNRGSRPLCIWLTLNTITWEISHTIGDFDQLTLRRSHISGPSYTALRVNTPVTFTMAALTPTLSKLLGIWLKRPHTLGGQESFDFSASAAQKA